MVSQAAGFADPPGDQVYEDVPPGSPFYDYVQRLTHRGVMGGYQCGILPHEPCIPPNDRPYFRPNTNATRGQISTIVSEAARLSDPVTGQRFEDVGPDHPFYTWIERLSSRNVVSGYPCGTLPQEPCVLPDNRPYFRPSNFVTRGQASKIVANTFYPGCHTPARP
jgi:hypothetical protein